jgi:Tol biopolymer transport system component
MRFTMNRESARRGHAAKTIAGIAVVGGMVVACSSSSSGTAADGGAAAGHSPQVAQAISQLGMSNWTGALASCLAAEAANHDVDAGIDAGAPGADCDARYCELVARTMIVVDKINTFLLPRYRRPLTVMPGDIENLADTNTKLDSAIQSAEVAAARQCEFDLPTLPLLIGDTDDPIVDAEVRGHWTVRDTHMLAALFDSISYGLQAEFNAQTVPPPPAGDTVPALPPLLESMRQHLAAEDALLVSQPADPDAGRGGWLDKNGDKQPGPGDELLVDIFEKGTTQRTFDFSTATFGRSDPLPLGALTPTANLPPAACGYRQYHVDTIFQGANVSATDGMTFSPDSTKIAVPLLEDGKSQIHLANPDGTNVTCITCGQPGNNDGVRWRPGDANTIIFISDRDHADATGNAGGGFGQELYAMRADGSQATRLTQSHIWATNYHVNWSPDGNHIVWGRTEARAWDVMVADFVDDATGMHLSNTRTLVHETGWWETHGFTADNRYVITTNTRAGFQSTDLYAVEIATGNRIRLTDNNAWDEHGHLSPDGREMTWISGRWNPASVLRLNDGVLQPTYDWLWIIPGIFFEFLNPPAGYTSELTMMDTDGQNIRALTMDKQVCADNQWSFDGRKIIFRETNPVDQSTRLRVLTFDDCSGGGTSPDAGTDSGASVDSGAGVDSGASVDAGL